MQKLPLSFYIKNDVLKIATDLLGKVLVTNWNDEYTSGRIVETEAYNGVVDKASRAYGNRRTTRTEIMYANGGKAYIYLCYGIHHLFNVVTNNTGIPHAILIRAAEPLLGIEYMLERTKKTTADYTLTKGPGNLSKAMGLQTSHTGKSLLENEIFIASDGMKLKRKDIISTTRIGVDYAQEDALLLYRFYLANNPYVSKPHPRPLS